MRSGAIFPVLLPTMELCIPEVETPLDIELEVSQVSQYASTTSAQPEAAKGSIGASKDSEHSCFVSQAWSSGLGFRPVSTHMASWTFGRKTRQSIH